MVALRTGVPTALPWLILDDPMGQVQAQHRHLTGTLLAGIGSTQQPGLCLRRATA
jgi:hypothetical protein